MIITIKIRFDCEPTERFEDDDKPQIRLRNLQFSAKLNKDIKSVKFSRNKDAIITFNKVIMNSKEYTTVCSDFPNKINLSLKEFCDQLLYNHECTKNDRLTIPSYWIGAITEDK